MAKSRLPQPEPKTENKPRQPERKFGPFANGVGVCIWSNTTETEEGAKKFRSITINPRRYFDKESNQWKDAPSFNPADLPALLFCLTKALDYCYAEGIPDANSDLSNSANGKGDGEETPF